MKKPVKEDCYCTEHDYLTHGCQCEFKEWNDAIDEYDAWLKEKIDNLLPFIDNYPFTDSLFPSQIVEITNAITKHLLEE